MTTAFLLLLVLLQLVLPVLVSSVDDYVYQIYYQPSTQGCTQLGVALQGYVVNESVIRWPVNTTDQRCVSDMYCAIQGLSAQCFTRNPGSPVNETLQMLNNGTLQACSDGTSCQRFPSCNQSSLYPNCKVNSVTTSTLLSNPGQITNTEGTVGPGVDTSYVILYNDSKCTHFAATLAITAQGVDVSSVPEGSGCIESMACLLNRNGTTCLALNPSPEQESLTSYVSDDGAVVTLCDPSGDCIAYGPKQCIRSTLYPDCYRRIVSALYLFADPVQYLTPPPPTSWSSIRKVGLLGSTSTGFLTLMMFMAWIGC